MNRREFLKGVGGIFIAFLIWAGVVRGEETEEPAQPSESFDDIVDDFSKACANIISQVDATKAAIREMDSEQGETAE